MDEKSIKTRPGLSRPTIRDVARLAGVSLGTASKALSGQGRMRPETRRNVEQVAKDIGFHPNDLAQSLHRNRSYTVGIISNDNFGRFTFPIVEALEEQLANERFAVFMSNATDDPERERAHVAALMAKRVDGFVVTARRADRRPKLQIPANGPPVIYVFSRADDEDALCLLPDDEGGARLGVDHLIRLGRKRIAHVTGPERFEAVRLRRDGWQKSLRAAGIEGSYLSGVWSEQWGRESVSKLFADKRTAPDAVFCGNDQIARGVIDALRERSIYVPADVSVVGFDNWEVMAEAARPPLTTIDMNLEEMGRETGRLLVELIGGKHLHGTRRLPCSLVIRDSCGAKRTTTN
ncbi:MAG TPA: LacI family DNA-binding transcriptional regulator [Aestuariivirga sp.]